MKAEHDGSWSPYLAGGLSGLVSLFAVLTADKFLGASTTFVKTAGMIESSVAHERVSAMAYFIKEVPKIDWQWMFVVGIFLGSLIAALTSKSFKWQAVPDMWQERFGTSVPKRAAIAFIGGIIAIFGARLADGCPSGHGLSGSLQLAVSGLIALVCFFIGGIIMTRMLYGGGDRR
jgi:hypothetical protein